ncbi:hypothetical protein GALMADRAFT_143090 [Galerina marginata CBS 339.88]|uniref:Uncharacterized protein n=1 Tax=Galerina marginata (strain CBS 339.88) TaxID=685588 RepID=A0A067SMR2_GALM3|nr:hypothetical protein GALMADRAFT_143090 [Galerina marginata CBS 339.88]
MPTKKSSRGSAPPPNRRSRTILRGTITRIYHISIIGNIHIHDHSTNVSNVNSNNATETRFERSQVVLEADPAANHLAPEDMGSHLLPRTLGEPVGASSNESIIRGQ